MAHLDVEARILRICRKSFKMANKWRYRAGNAPINSSRSLRPICPRVREGKHKAILTQLLSDLDQALKIPLTELSDTKENIRSALNCATRI